MDIKEIIISILPILICIVLILGLLNILLVAISNKINRNYEDKFNNYTSLKVGMSRKEIKSIMKKAKRKQIGSSISYSYKYRSNFSTKSKGKKVVIEFDKKGFSKHIQAYNTFSSITKRELNKLV